MKNKGKSIILFGVAILCVFSIVYFSFKGSYSLESENDEPEIILVCNDSDIEVDSCNSESNCTSSIPGNTIECSVKGRNFDYNVDAFDFKVNLSSNLEALEFNLDSNLFVVDSGDDITNLPSESGNWFGSVENGWVSLIPDLSQTGNFNIIDFTATVKSSAPAGATETISLSDVSIINDSYEEIEMPTASFSVKVLSSINTLSNLTVSGSNIVFDSDVTEYHDTIDAETVTIAATKSDENSTITGDVGEKNLNYGNNVFTITVTSQAGSSKNYVIIINRPDNRVTIANDISNEVINEVSYFMNIAPNTDVSTIKGKIETTGVITVKNNNGIVLNNNEKLITGNKVIVTLSNNEIREYVVIIPGDVNIDGSVDLGDVTRLYKYYRGKTEIPTSNEYYFIVSDIVRNNAIGLNDVTKLYKYYRGILSELVY